MSIIVAACALAPGAGAAVPVDCANPQAPRVPFAAAAPATPVTGGTLPAGAAIPDQVIVSFAPSVGAAGQAGALSVVSPDVVQRAPDLPEQVVEYAAGATPEAAAAALEARGVVQFAEPNFAVVTTAVPNDPDFDLIWPYQTESAPGAPRRPGDLRAEDAWALSSGAGVRVAVVDTGVDPRSLDLEPGVLHNPADPANGVDDDGNGLVDDTRGWDFVADAPNLSDDGGHGTHVAGIIGARSDNGLLVPGLASGVSVVPVRALGARFGSIADVVAGYTYAIEQYGVRVVNLSLAGSSFSEFDATGLCRYPNVLFVAAAGNDSRDVDAQPAYPCAYDLPHVLCVGATDERDGLASFSNRGPATIEIGAPGVSILSTGFGVTSQTYSGTSQAAPMVSAVAALVLERAPGLTAAELKDVLLRTADRVPGLAPHIEEGRRLNAGRAVAAVSPPVVRDARVESRNGVATLLGTLVTDGPTELYALHGRPGALTARTDPRQAQDALSFAIPVPGAAANARFRLVADNARGHYESPELAVAGRPAVSITVRRARGALVVSGRVRGLARVQIRSFELVVARGARAPRRSSAALTLRSRTPLETAVSARLGAVKGTRYRVTLRITTDTGTTAEATARVRA